MSNIYLGQPFTIILETGTSLSTATSLRIRVKYPKLSSKADLLLTATLVNGSTTAITASMTGAQNNTVGTLELWAWVVFPGDTGVVPGGPYRLEINPV